MSEKIDRIVKLASIKMYIAQNMPKHLRVLQDNIQLPSIDGDYADCDAVIIVYSQMQKEELLKLFYDNAIDAKIAIICL